MCWDAIKRLQATKVNQFQRKQWRCENSRPVGPENAPLVLTFLETNSICVRFVHLNLKGMVMVDDDADIERGGSGSLWLLLAPAPGG